VRKNIVSFRKIDEFDIQLVRFWRNSDHVRLQMIDQEYISPEQQISWFKTLDKKGEHHFIYSYGVHDVGVVSIKTLGSPGVFEAGIFCGRTDYLGNPINIAAAMGLHDYGFHTLGNRKSKVRVLRENSSALRMNNFLGFERTNNGDEKIIELELTRDKYELSKTKLIRVIPWTSSFPTEQ
jgi:hypothetical protein